MNGAAGISSKQKKLAANFLQLPSDAAQNVNTANITYCIVHCSSSHIQLIALSLHSSCWGIWRDISVSCSVTHAQEASIQDEREQIYMLYTKQNWQPCSTRMMLAASEKVSDSYGCLMKAEQGCYKCSESLQQARHMNYQQIPKIAAGQEDSYTPS